VRRTLVFAVPDFMPALGGTTTQVGVLSRELASRGHDVRVITRRRDRSWLASEVLGSIRVDRLGPPGRGAPADKVAALALMAWLARRRRDVRIMQTVMWTDAVPAAAAARLLPRTIVGWGALGDATDALRGGSSPLRRAQTRLRRRLFTRCEHVVLTPAMHDELVALGLERCTILPVPLDLQRFHPPSPAERTDARSSLGLADDEVAIAYVGHLRALKRIDLLVAAVASLAGESIPVRLVLAGGSRGAEDDVEHELHEQVRALALEDRVVFTGIVADPRPVLWAADVFALASEREGLPNSLLEAMACGLACVASASSAGNELLEGGAGLVPVDTAALHDALRTLALDAALRERLGRRAVERAGEYDVARVADGYERLYARVAS
jgi:glycosyltransferase involved in cell wall biosynthesis